MIKGDGKYQSIAAASILAKHYRDNLMHELSIKYPGYGWETNVGYPSKKHRRAIVELGMTNLHRKSFKFKISDLYPEKLGEQGKLTLDD